MEFYNYDRCTKVVTAAIMAAYGSPEDTIKFCLQNRISFRVNASGVFIR